MIANLANGLVAKGSMEAINGGQLFDLQTMLEGKIDGVNDVVKGINDRVGQIEQGIADGSIGKPSPADPNHPVNAPGSGDNSVAIGNGSVASGSNSSAVGGGAKATGDNATAIGAGSVASGDKSTAIGAGSQATADNSVALGAGSVADRANTVSVGSEGHERQITNVAAGTAPTDAVNVQQLRDAKDWAQNYTDQRVNQLNRSIDRVGRRADGGTASALATANLPQALAASQNMVGAGIGTFNGQSAIAMGLSTVTPDGRWVLRASATANTLGDKGAGIGIGMAW